MYWQLEPEPIPEPAETPPPDAPRFVLHRHHDALGPHLDLRLEREGYLIGWRICGTALEGDLWAQEKAPHPLHWLDQDGDAVREDAGVYAWHTRDATGGELMLWGRAGIRRLRVRAVQGLAPEVVRAVVQTLETRRIPPEQAPQLLIDGLTARQRALTRLCGLGRELDGPAFDEALWRRSLETLSLDESHPHLRGYELRFDQQYPPRRISKPEPLDPGQGHAREEAALHILNT